MPKNKILPYNPKLKILARQLRNNSTLAEVIIWNNIKGCVLGFEFHRQVPIDEYIVDFYCHELLLAIEIDGSTHYYNYHKDRIRESKLESLGIKVIRFEDLDIKKFMNDVIRCLEFIISERKKELKL